MIHTIGKYLAVAILSGFLVQSVLADSRPDVMHYDLKITPDIDQALITGSVVIDFRIKPGQQSVTFDKGALEIMEVTGETLDSFSAAGNRLILELKARNNVVNHRVFIRYRGAPKRGLLFNEEKKQAYTVFFTSQWMICNDDPADKASIDMELTLPMTMQCIATGVLKEVKEEGGLKHHRWMQEFETASYTYGFAIGVFREQVMSADPLIVKNYSADKSPEKINQIFRETPAMIAFFEEKSGVPYDLKSYNQLLVGNHYQEMSGFSVLKSTYGDLVLKDSTETNLISHELSHQWWGNRITCESWNHFWLNEAVATFMSAAYNEHRFGNTKYMADINAYKRVYTDIKNRGKDKPLVFESWTNPSRDDRNIVYFKGAYVLHLLRQQMGDAAFWKGIQSYSTRFFDQSVTTTDFQNSMQEATDQDLSGFFDEWVY
ncbi:MAG: M1 family metallopeptidase [Bacteroidota bacterium]